MGQCGLCPRGCNVDRTHGKKGYCGESDIVRVARVSLHMWEEPCISGENGSGTVFFSGCPLRCVFCQNKMISLGNKGYVLTEDELCRTFLVLQEHHAENINLVTPTHFVPQIAKALKLAKENGLVIPVVYNTGSYENVETIKMLEGLVDIYLPDLKFKSDKLSQRYSNAPDYFEKAVIAIEEMVRQTKKTVFEGGMMKRGTIVRHMIMPGQTKDSKEIVNYLYERYRDDIYISIMNQYTPPMDVKEWEYTEISRKVTKREYEKVIDYAINIGVTNAFIQEGDTAQENYIPDFEDRTLLNDVLGKE